MKSTIIDTPPSASKPTYPYLGIYKYDFGSITILFKKKNSGTVVATEGKRKEKIGNFSDTWAEENFIRFQGKIELSN